MSSDWQHLARLLVLATTLALLPTSVAHAQASRLDSPLRGSAASSTAASSTAASSTAASSPAATSGDIAALGSPLTDTRQPAHDDVRFDVALSTHVPVSVGVDLSVTFPYGLLLRAHLGGTPEPYVGIVNEVAVAADGYDRETADVVARTGGGAFALRLEAGIRPFAGYGFEVLAGYTVLFAQTRLDRESFEAATGERLPPVGDDIGLSATLHALTINVGYSAELFEHLVLRGSIGWVHTIAAEAHIDVPQPVRDRMPIERYEGNIAHAITTWGFAPEVRIAVGYLF